MFSLLTPKVALVPADYFDPSKAREILSETVSLGEKDNVEYISMPEWSAVLVYSLSVANAMSRSVAGSCEGVDESRVLPEMFFILKGLEQVSEYNKVVASYADGYLHLAIAQGRNLKLANVFKAPDFTTAEYFIFLSLSKLQMNPEVSCICFRTSLTEDQKMSLYRYLNLVEEL